LLDDEQKSVVVLDTDGNDDDEYTISGLSADTNYTLLVAAESVAGLSENTIIINVITTSDTLVFWLITLAAVAIAPVILALIGVYACGRYVCL